jgi:hypothetical protein
LSELELEFELELEDELLEELLLDDIVQLVLEKVWSKARGRFTSSVFWSPPPVFKRWIIEGSTQLNVEQFVDNLIRN